MVFAPATRKKVKLKLALCGPAGSGKTKTALRMATALAAGGKIAMIDTENKSGDLYVGDKEPEGVLKYDIQQLRTFTVPQYISAIKEAVAAKYSVLILDTISHAWMGAGGILEMVDRGSEKNRFAAWRKPDEMYRNLVDAILGADIHIIATMRSKMAYAEETDERGNKKMKKIGMAPVMRDNIEYEFSVVGDLDINHNLTFSKTRCPDLLDTSFQKAGGEVIQVIREWLDRGIDAPAEPEKAEEPATHEPAEADDTFYGDGEDRDSHAETRNHGTTTAPPAHKKPDVAVTENAKFKTMVAQLENCTNMADFKALMNLVEEEWTDAEKSALKPHAYNVVKRIKATTKAATAPTGDTAH